MADVRWTKMSCYREAVAHIQCRVVRSTLCARRHYQYTSTNPTMTRLLTLNVITDLGVLKLVRELHLVRQYIARGCRPVNGWGAEASSGHPFSRDVDVHLDFVRTAVVWRGDDGVV